MQPDYTCPSCGAAVKFQSSVTLSTVCIYCRSLLVRHGIDLTLLGTMSELPMDISPFQIGTAGKYVDAHFSIIGRMRIGWEDGAWNEWFLLFEDARKAWLAEAQGFLAISFEFKETLPQKTQDILSSPDIQLGTQVSLDGAMYTVADMKQAECIGSEGELPFVAAKGRKTRVIDLIGRDGRFASVEVDKDGTLRVYTGAYVTFDALRFTNLRELPGWKVTRSNSTATPKAEKPDAGW